jgi:hypothetical protein
VSGFRDKSFCGSDCTDTSCDRNVTDEVKAAARRWWAGIRPDTEAPGWGPPMLMADYSSICPDYRPQEVTHGPV